MPLRTPPRAAQLPSSPHTRRCQCECRLDLSAGVLLPVGRPAAGAFIGRWGRGFAAKIRVRLSGSAVGGGLVPHQVGGEDYRKRGHDMPKVMATLLPDHSALMGRLRRSYRHHKYNQLFCLALTKGVRNSDSLYGWSLPLLL